jgi:uncharacterized protein involved in exopolysaccharide biosynthesis
MAELELDGAAGGVTRDGARERRLVARLALRALWHSRYHVAVLCALGLLFGLYQGLSRPNIYLSQAKMLLRFGEREQITGESLLGASVQRESSPTIEDEIHMLYDEEVFLRVVNHIGPHRLLEVEDPRNGDGPSTPIWVKAAHAIQAVLMSAGSSTGDLSRFKTEQLAVLATDALMKDTQIVAESNSNVITLRTVSTSPGKAQYIAGLLLEAFIDRHRDQFSLDRYLPAYRKKHDDAKVEFDAAREALAAHQTETGFLDITTQKELLLTSIGEANQTIATTKSSVQGLERERDLTAAALAENRESLTSAKYAELRDRLQTLAIEIPTGQVAIDSQIAELERQRAELLRLEASAKVQDVLGAEVERSGRLFREIAERLTKIEALAQIDVDGDTNLMPLQMPTLPLQKEGPKRAKLLVLGTAAGFALGLLVAALRYLFDGRVRYAEQLERDFGVRVIAVVPRFDLLGSTSAEQVREAA